MSTPTFIKSQSITVRSHESGVNPADIIQHASRAELATPASRLDERCRRLGKPRCFSLVRQSRRSDIPTILAEGRVIDRRIPIPVLPEPHAVAEHVRKVVVVRERLHVERGFQLLDRRGVAGLQDRVGDIDQLLLRGDAGLWTVLADGLVVLPVVPEGVGDPGGGYASPPVLRVELPEERYEAAAVGSAVCEVWDIGGGQVQIF